MSTLDTTTITGAYTDAMHGGTAGRAAWRGGAFGPDGKVYCAPWNAESVLVIDTSTGGLNHIDFSHTNALYKYRNPVVASNGKIYFLPYRGKEVMILNTTTGAIDTSSISGLRTLTGVENNLWKGGVLANNGKIYGNSACV